MYIRKELLIAAAVLLLGAFASQFSVGRAAQDFKYYTNPGSELPFSLAVEAGNTLYVAGTIGIDPATGAPPDDPKAEARLVMNNIKARLEEAGLTMNDLVSVQVFCSDVALYDDFNAVYRTYFDGKFPARAFLGSGTLLLNGRFEVLGIAVRR